MPMITATIIGAAEWSLAAVALVEVAVLAVVSAVAALAVVVPVVAFENIYEQ
jgi:hypothetical protein